jgi:hypothetical protein
MSTIGEPASAPASAPAREQFLDVVLGDEDLLRAEFDAIIADAWDDPPRAARRPPPPRRLARSEPGGLRYARRPGLSAWARQRSPPRCPPGRRDQVRRG